MQYFMACQATDPGDRLWESVTPIVYRVATVTLPACERTQTYFRSASGYHAIAGLHCHAIKK